MLIRKTKEEDVATILEIIEITRENFRKEFIPQWQGEYPSRDVILTDISNGESYVCEDNGKVVGFCAIIPGKDPSYKNIYDGEWKAAGGYVALHRVALHPNVKGKGVAHMFVGEAVSVAKDLGLFSVKCDTHRKNISMRRMLEKNGFEYCGIIYLCDDGAERFAYQKLV